MHRIFSLQPKRAFFFLLFLLSIESNAQLGILSTKSTFIELRKDSLTCTIDSLLIISYGHSIIRSFFEDISTSLIAKFQHKNIKADYFYLGKSVETAKSEFEKINMTGYKAVLFYLPIDTSEFTMTTFLNPIANTNTLQLKMGNVEIEQRFEFQLYKISKSYELVWLAEMFMKCTPKELYGSRKVANLIFTSFKNNKYISR